MGLGIIAEGIARLEHKLDLIISSIMKKGSVVTPMHFAGHRCPVCTQNVDYQVDLTHNVVVRRCGCTTGKQPATIPLFPAVGAQNAAGTSAQSSDEGGGNQSETRYRR